MLKPNRVKKTLAEGGVCFGTMLRILKTPHAIPLCAAAGWDYVILDTEHADYNLETLSNMSLASKYEEPALLIRVPDHLYHELARPLDLGIEGLVIPRVDTPEDVRRIIESTKYYPLGSRGASLSATAARYRPCNANEFLKWSNEETLIVIQIESQQAVEQVEELVSIPGVDAVMIGPFDLSQSMGIPGQLQHPRILDAYERVIEGCNRHGVAPGIHLLSIEAVTRWVKAGMRFVTYQYDIKFFTDACQSALSQLRAVTQA